MCSGEQDGQAKGQWTSSLGVLISTATWCDFKTICSPVTFHVTYYQELIFAFFLFFFLLFFTLFSSPSGLKFLAPAALVDHSVLGRGCAV